MVTSTSESESRSFQWIREFFERFLTRRERINEVLGLSILGIQLVPGRHNAIETLAKVLDAPADPGHLGRAARERDLARRELEAGFPVLYEQATIALWGALVSLVRDFLAAWLANTPAAWEREKVRSQKVRVGEFMGLEPYEQCVWLIDLIDQDIRGPMRAGVNRFEELLKVFGLEGNVPSDCKDGLFELWHIRNALVHRSATVDRKIADACPWLGLEIGGALKISREMWERYDTAVMDYVILLIERVKETRANARAESSVEEAPSK